jgi:hypothetical protein
MNAEHTFPVKNIKKQASAKKKNVINVVHILPLCILVKAKPFKLN